jgi:hypothetical protein
VAAHHTLVGGIFLWEGNATASTVRPTAPTTRTFLPHRRPPDKQRPTITLNIAYRAGKQVTLSGIVTDRRPGNRDAGRAVNTTVVTNADGTFSWTGDAAALGTVTAATTDFWGAASNTAQVAVVSAAPVISNFTAEEGDAPQRRWLFKGQVTDESFYGLTVRFGGLPSLANETTTVESNGWFYLFVDLEEGEGGTVWCQTTDWWGLDSNVAEDYVVQTTGPGPGGFGGSLPPP